MKNFTSKDVDLFNKKIKEHPLTQIAVSIITNQPFSDVECVNVEQLKKTYEAIKEVATISGFEDLPIKTSIVDRVFSQHEKTIQELFDKITKTDESIMTAMFDKFSFGQICTQTKAVKRYIIDAVLYDMAFKLYKWCDNLLGD